MSAIPAPNIFQDATQIAQMPQNALQEYARTAALQQQTEASRQEMQQRSLEMQAQQRQLNDQDAQTKTITQFDPTKNTINDVPGMFVKNGGSGAGALALQQGLIAQKKNLAGLTDEQLAQQQKQMDLTQGVHDAVTQAPPEQKNTVYQAGLHQLQAAGVDTSKEPLQYPGDDVFAQHLPAIRFHSAILADEQKDRETTAKEQEAQAKIAGAQTTQQRLQAEMPGGPLEAPDKAELADWLKKNPDKGPSDYVAWKAKQTPTAMVLGNMLGQGGANSALDQQAEKYFQTGQLPGGFSRSPGTTAAIIQRANALHPGESLAENQAGYKANQASLTGLQKNFDTVSAFENTAGKNLDLYLQKLNAIPDLGVKFANVPLRMIDDKLVGSDNYQAMKAAQQTAAAEVAKVLSSANASGVLSDSQKKEAEDILSGNLSYSAAKNVVATLKQDFANRHQSYQAQIADIQGRLGQGSKPTPQTGGNLGGGGKTLSLAAVQKAAKDHGVSVDEAKRQAQAAGYTIQ
jgi:hypothetical protein